MGAICHSCLSHLSLWMWQVVWLLHISKCQLSVLRNGDLSRKADGFPGLDFPEDWSLDMHGCLWAFKQSIPPPTRPPIQLPKKHPALYYILLYSLPPRSSMLRFCFSSPVGNVKREPFDFWGTWGIKQSNFIKCLHGFSHWGMWSRWSRGFQIWGGIFSPPGVQNWKAALKLIVCFRRAVTFLTCLSLRGSMWSSSFNPLSQIRGHPHMWTHTFFSPHTMHLDSIKFLHCS